MNLYNFYKNPEELNGYEDRIYHVPVLAFVELLSKSKAKDKDKLEDAVAKSPEWSSKYAQRTNKPFPKGEDAIGKNAMYSFEYARDILDGPFPKGEDAISKHTSAAFYYATNVLKTRWIPGEKAISSNFTLWDKYNAKFIKHKLDPLSAFYELTKNTNSANKEDLEHIISLSPEISYQYALFIKKPFKAGEKAIASMPNFSYLYAKNVLEGPFKEGEYVISSYPLFALKYAKKVLHARFKIAEYLIWSCQNTNENDLEEIYNEYFSYFKVPQKTIEKFEEYAEDGEVGGYEHSTFDVYTKFKYLKQFSYSDISLEEQ